jgi:hypothetical protein
MHRGRQLFVNFVFGVPHLTAETMLQLRKTNINFSFLVCVKHEFTAMSQKVTNLVDFTIGNCDWIISDHS